MYYANKFAFMELTSKLHSFDFRVLFYCIFGVQSTVLLFEEETETEGLTCNVCVQLGYHCFEIQRQNHKTMQKKVD